MPKDILASRIDETDIARVPDGHVDRLRRHKLSKGDIVYGRRGDIGRHALIRDENVGWLCGTGCLRITLGSSSVVPDFLHRYLQLAEVIRWVEGQAIGATMPNLNTNIVRRTPVTFPVNTKTQRKIAAILSAYDELIENNKHRVALLEKLAEQIYREWFVRLRFPGHEKVKFVKGIPEGWRNQRFGQFCLLQRGYDLPDADVEPGPYPVMASTSIKAYHNQYKVEPPVITTGRSGSLGEVLIVHTRAWPHNTALYVRQFFGNSSFLVYYTLKNMRLENFNAGAGVPTLNRNHLDGIPIIVPNKELQSRFDHVVSTVHSQVELLRRSNENLTTTRDRLLPRLISAKLSVEDLDIQFPPGMAEKTAASS
jgi:type I restriction enzyme, S subunit